MEEKSNSNSKSSSNDFQFQLQGAKLQNRAKSQVWDCGSSLYDSFELQSLKLQLNSAIIASSRSFSMPHLSSRRAPPPPPTAAKRPSKLSRSFQRLLRSVFRPSKRSESKIGSLTTIPEASDFNCAPVINSIARKAASARFSNISCT